MQSLMRPKAGQGLELQGSVQLVRVYNEQQRRRRSCKGINLSRISCASETHRHKELIISTKMSDRQETNSHLQTSKYSLRERGD